jgi:carboxypeptidase family protein
MGSPRSEISVRQRATGLFGNARRMPPCRASTSPSFPLRCGATLLAVGLALMPPSAATLWAQGATGAAVQGMISGADSVPVADATVLITNSATGERWRTHTHTDGRFLLDHLSIGGPYRLEVDAIGFEPAQREGMFLSLGERLTSDFRLTPTALQLPEVSVQAEPDPRINAGRTGPAMTVRESTIVRLPVDGRDYTRLALLSPLVTPSANAGLSFAGQHDRLNSLQVDGTTDNNLSGGLYDGIFGIPGSQSSFGLFALTPEAVAEVQAMAAPFDVRYGNFAGGLVNAVSRSGSNRWEGSVFGYFDSPSLSGTNPDGSRQDPFSRQEYGFTLGGPIVRDRVAFFLSGDARRQEFPRTTSGPGRDTTSGADSAGVGIRYATVTRFQEILAKEYGVNAGTFDALPSQVPTRSLFAKISVQLGINDRLEVSHDHFWEGPWYSGEHDYGFLGFVSHGSYDPRTVDATRLDWTAAFGSRWTNQLLLARRRDRHICFPLATFPTVEVAVDAGTVIAGEQEGCRQDNFQSIWELTDNLELTAGPHHLTLGTHDELIHIYDGGGIASDQGYWFFTSLDSLEQAARSVYPGRAWTDPADGRASGFQGEPGGILLAGSMAALTAAHPHRRAAIRRSGSDHDSSAEP